VGHGNDPGSLGAVDGSKILREPVDLLEGGVVGVASVDVTEWTTVSNKGLLLCREGLVGQCADVSNEGVFWGLIALRLENAKIAYRIVATYLSVVSLAVKGDEVSHA